MDAIKSLAPAIQSGKRFDPETDKIREPQVMGVIVGVTVGMGVDLSPIDVNIQDMLKRTLEEDNMMHKAPSWLPWM